MIGLFKLQISSRKSNMPTGFDHFNSSVVWFILFMLKFEAGDGSRVRKVRVYFFYLIENKNKTASIPIAKLIWWLNGFWVTLIFVKLASHFMRQPFKMLFWVFLRFMFALEWVRFLNTLISYNRADHVWFWSFKFVHLMFMFK